MKKLIYLLAIFIVTTACKNDKKGKKSDNNSLAEYTSFGEKIDTKSILSATQMMSKYETLQVGDSVNIKFTSSISDLCTKKGCWMKLDLDNNSETMVRFKDYGFFMPLDAKGKEVIIEGKAFLKQVSVEELKHYAEDAGKSKEEIDAITQPKTEYAFEAKGVLMKK